MKALKDANKDAETNGVPESVAKWVTTLTAIWALLATIGGAAVTASGGVARMFREQPWFTLLAIAGIVLGFFVMAVAFVLFPGASKPSQALRTRSLAAAFGAFTLALVFGAIAVGRVSATEEQPSIVAAVKSDNGLRLDGTITVSGMPSSERLNVRVQGFLTGRRPDDRPLLQTVVGADRDGAASIPLDISLDGRAIQEVQITAWSTNLQEPNCNEVVGTRLRGVACAVMRVPPSTESRPRVDFRYEGEGAARVLTGTVKAKLTVGESVLVIVRGRLTAASDDEVLYSSRLIPDRTGTIEHPLTITVGQRLPISCVVAEVVAAAERPQDADCPPTDARRAASWVFLRTEPSPPAPTTPAPTP